MKLVIAEKPSVAQSLAAVIGANIRKDGYLEGNGWRVSWCVGHLAGLADADAYNPDYAKWRYDDLPILPEPWQMVVSDLPQRLRAGGLPEAYETALDFLDGRFRHPGGLCEPAPRYGL